MGRTAGQKQPLTFLSLFAGIGMHDLGLERAGMVCIGQVEWDAYCSAVLEKHWPHLPRWSDVRHVTVESIRERCGRIDCISGGFSCKDISVAGAGRGIGKETESGITWRNMFRLIRGLLPNWLVIENVPRLRTLAADRVLAALERIGYACWPVVVGAEHLGAPHRRQRVWIVAYSARHDHARLDGEAWRRRGTSSTGAATMADTEIGGRPGQGQCGKTKIARLGSDSAPIPLADAIGSRLEIGRARTSGAGAQIAMSTSGVRHCWPSRPSEPQHEWEAPRLVESSLGCATPRHARRVAGFARRNALKALGNGNPPQCAEAIGNLIVQAHARSEAPCL